MPSEANANRITEIIFIQGERAVVMREGIESPVKIDLNAMIEEINDQIQEHNFCLSHPPHFFNPS